MPLVMLLEDLWHQQDGGNASILALHGLSVTFNTINHIVLDQLQGLGLSGTILEDSLLSLGADTSQCSLYLFDENNCSVGMCVVHKINAPSFIR